MILHSRDIKQNILEILKERLNLLYWNLIQLNFILNMFSDGQSCKENSNFILLLMLGMTSQHVEVGSLPQIRKCLNKTAIALP